MILTELKAYLAQRRESSLRDLALHFDSDVEAVRRQLALLERKGWVQKLPAGSACTGCSSCAVDTVELYRWIAREELVAVPLRFGSIGCN